VRKEVKEDYVIFFYDTEQYHIFIKFCMRNENFCHIYIGVEINHIVRTIRRADRRIDFNINTLGDPISIVRNIYSNKKRSIITLRFCNPEIILKDNKFYINGIECE
jgi:hypothetical protein